MKRSIIAAFAFFLLLSNFLNGQSSVAGYQNPLEAVNVPAPTPASLGQFGHTPIGYYHGTADISIPIFNLNAGSFSFPISLSYNSGGVKVEDIASWIGLGWNLNAGGCITANIKGTSDLRGPRLSDPNIKMKIRTDLDLQGGDFPLTYCESCPIDTLYSVGMGWADAEPDIYNYNFCGFSGQFIFDRVSNQAKFIKNSDGLIIKLNPSNNEITASDNYGRKYIFSIFDSTNTGTKTFPYHYNNLNLIPNFPPTTGLMESFSTRTYYDITSIWLKKIVLENNEGELVFDYAKESSYSTSRLSGAITAITEASYTKWIGEENQALRWRCTLNESSRLTEIKYLKEGTEIWKVEFIPSENKRDDLKGTCSLKKVKLSANGKEVKHWNFYQSFYSSTVSKFEEFINGYERNIASNRLKLDSISEGFLNSQLPAYKFTYLGDPGSSNPGLKLPYRTSFDGYDHWGYCNKSVSSTDAVLPSRLFPKFTPYSMNDVYYTEFYCKGNVQGNITTRPIDNLGCRYIPPFETYVPPPATGGPPFIGNHPMGDRTPDLDYAKIGTLEYITYPTGGYTKYSYELHTLVPGAYNSPYTVAGGLRVASITDYDAMGNSTIRTLNYYSGGYLRTKPYYIYPLSKEDGTNFSFYNCACLYSQGIYLDGYSLNTSSIANSNSPSEDHVYYPIVSEVFDKREVKYFYDNSTINYNSFNTQVFYVEHYFDNNTPQITTKTNNFYCAKPTFPFTKGYTGPSYMNGKIKIIDYLNKENSEIRVKREVFEYEVIETGKVFGNEVYLEHIGNAHPTSRWLNAYYYETGKTFLKTKTTILNDEQGGSPVETIENYTYNSDYELLKSKELISSDKSIMTSITYPFDYPDETYEEAMGNRTPILEALNYMTYRNIVAIPIETMISVSGGWKDGTLNLYRRNGNNVFPSASYNYNNGTPQMGAKAFNGRVENPTYFHRKMNYDIFDESNNCIQKHQDDGCINTYKWGYNNALLIAAVKNADTSECGYTGFENHEAPGWQQFSSWLFTDNTDAVKTGQSGIFVNGGGPAKYFSVGTLAGTHSGYKASVWVKGGTDAYLHIQVNDDFSLSKRALNPNTPSGDWNLIEVELPYYYYKNNINSSLRIKVFCGSSGTAVFDDLRFHPMDAQMTTYTYEPLIGVTSVSDINNKPTYYNYDAFNRLWYVQDFLGNILKKYEYHYKQ